jgi:anti-sigma regulatory factor (Ser/Thr protein kinase)
MERASRADRIGPLGQEIEITLDSQPESVARARQVTTEAIDGLSEDALEDVRLIVSELVTNAIKHGPQGRVTVRIWREDGMIRGEVEDEGTSPFGTSPVGLRRKSRIGPDGGLGLRLVDTLSDRWGVGPGPSRVWFELRDRSA